MACSVFIRFRGVKRAIDFESRMLDGRIVVQSLSEIWEATWLSVILNSPCAIASWALSLC